jgi:CheY-like chemotaxis protein
LIRGLNAGIGRKDFFKMASKKDGPMEENRDNREYQESQVTGLSQKRDAVYKPLDLAMTKKGFDIGKRSTLAEKSAPFRQSYLEELKRDLDEITEEIIKTESLKDILPMLTTKYAIERNILAHERNLMSEEQSLLSEKRSRLSQERTELSEIRSGLSRIRTQASQRSTFLSEKRSLMSQQRTFLAKARTELAFIRTGVALVALASGLMRYFGFNWWTVIDVSIAVLGTVMVISGVYYYLPTRKKEGSLMDVMRQKEDELMHRKPRIMVLDDDVSVCNSLKIYLGKAKWEVEAFTSPYVARHRLEAAPFDVVITDFLMEEMTGIEFLRHIRRLAPGIHVILISRMEMMDEFVKSVKGELFDHHPKPVNVKKLKESVHRALEERMMI